MVRVIVRASKFLRLVVIRGEENCTGGGGMSYTHTGWHCSLSFSFAFRHSCELSFSCACFDGHKNNVTDL